MGVRRVCGAWCELTCGEVYAHTGWREQCWGNEAQRGDGRALPPCGELLQSRCAAGAFTAPTDEVPVRERAHTDAVVVGWQRKAPLSNVRAQAAALAASPHTVQCIDDSDDDDDDVEQHDDPAAAAFLNFQSPPSTTRSHAAAAAPTHAALKEATDPYDVEQDDGAYADWFPVG